MYRSSLLLVLAVLTLAACDLGSYEPGPGGGTGAHPGDADAGPGGGGGGGNPTGRVHPTGFAAADVHGPELTLQQQDCRDCHGGDLAGATGPSCDACHTPAEPTAWRTDCTFCHGGAGDDSGAPPRNLDGSVTPEGGAFPDHAAHLGTTLMAAFDCRQCHAMPADALDANHVFDDTPGAAEAVFTAGMSPQAAFDGSGCSTTYCHGNGRGDNGTVAIAAGTLGCSSCHAGIDTPGQWTTMSGDHRRHLDDGMTCVECHATVTADDRSISDAALHIDGARAVQFEVDTIAYDPATRRCNGPCHGEEHNDTW